MLIFIENIQIKGVPVDLIKDYNDLLVAISSGGDLDPIAFEADANSWLDRFHANDDLNWNILSATVRKRLKINVEHSKLLYFILGSSCASSRKVSFML